MKVCEAMRAHVVTAAEDATVHDVVDLMDLYQVRCVPVVDDSMRPVGVVTERDVAGALLRGALDGSALERLRDAVRQPVRSLMTSPARCIDDQAEMADAARQMVEHAVSRLPVTAGGRVVGIISRIDVCEAILDEST